MQTGSIENVATQHGVTPLKLGEDVVDQIVASENLPDWKHFITRYHKQYKTLAEQMLRFQLFLASSIRVTTQWIAYKLNRATFFYAINKFSDLKASERLQRYGLHIDEIDRQNEIDVGAHSSERTLSKRDILGLFKSSTYSVDWRQNCLTKTILDQGECGSCYAMTAIKMVEWLYCRSRGKSMKFSEQFLVDCGEPFGLKGCEKGSILGAVNFIRSRGLLSSHVMPYLGAEQPNCPFPATTMSTDGLEYSQETIIPKEVNYKVLRTDSERLMELEHSPLVALISIDSDFFDYRGGVYVRNPKASEEESVGHYMLLVGWGHDKRAGEFWLFSNHFGEDWGESNGYIRMARSPDDHILNIVKVVADFD